MYKRQVYVRVLLEIEAIKLCARNRTAEDLENIERALEECEAKFYTEERVSKDFAYHQALARGAHNPVIAAMQRRHLKSLSEFAAAFNDENHFLE